MTDHYCAECLTAFPAPADPEAARCPHCGGRVHPTLETLQQGLRPSVAAQNDRFRATCGTDPALPGRIVVTAGVTAAGGAFVCCALQAMRDFDAFTPDNDPHGWHDFGAVEIEGRTVWWKIDLYDRAYRFGSDAPDDPEATRRVLTLLFPDEY